MRNLKFIICLICFTFVSQVFLNASEKEFKSGKTSVLIDEKTGNFRLYFNKTPVLEDKIKLNPGKDAIVLHLTGAKCKLLETPVYNGKKLEGAWIRLKGKTDDGKFLIVRTLVLSPVKIRSTLRISQAMDDKSATRVQEKIHLSGACFNAAAYEAFGEGHEPVTGILGGEKNVAWHMSQDSIGISFSSQKLGSINFLGDGQRYGGWRLLSKKKKAENIRLIFNDLIDSGSRGELSVNRWELNFCADKIKPSQVKEFRYDAMNPSDWKPENMDIFHNVTERIYLHGAWKIMPIKNSASNPPDDQGTKEKVYLSSFDDSAWKPYPVPYLWNKSGIPGVKSSDVLWIQSGIVWYRRTVDIPRYPANQRVFLHFDNAQTEATVFVNGKLVGRHLNNNRELNCNAESIEPFEFDITDFIHPGKNVIAVRVYVHASKEWTFRGGLCGPVYIDVRPVIHAKNIRITPDLKNLSIKIDGVIVNHGPETAVNAEIRIEPWKSKRYKMTGGKIYKGSLKLTAKTGRTPFSKNLPMPKAELWTPEHPFLYRCSIIDPRIATSGKRQAGLLGMARFGMRSFKVTGTEFHLNGHPVWLAGTSHEKLGGIEFPYYFNMDNYIERYVERMKKWGGANIERFWGPLFGNLFDICDEKGLMVETGVPISIDHYRDMMEGSEQARKDIAAICSDFASWCYNHPSVVTYNLGNEYYDVGHGGRRKLERMTLGKALTYAYNEMKKNDATRPVCNGSGRSAGSPYGGKGNEASATDFFQSHSYLNEIVIFDSVEFPGCYKNYVQAYGKEAPLVNGEWMSAWTPSKNKWPKLMGWVDDFLMRDRDGALDYYNQSKGGYMMWQVGGWKTSIAEADKHPEKLYDMQSKILRDEIDSMRRKNYCKGSYLYNPPVNGYRYGANVEEQNQKGTHEQCKLFLKYVKKAHAPFYACPDLFNRKLFRGGKLKADITIMNDTPAQLTDTAIRIRIISNKGTTIAEKTVPVGKLGEGEKKTMPVNLPIPVEIPEGDYSLRISALKDGKEKSDNEYDLVIMGTTGKMPKIKQTQRVGLYISDDKNKLAQTKKMLSDFGISYVPVKDLKNLESMPVDVLIIGMNGLDKRAVDNGSVIAEWIKKGHKLICLEQNKNIMLPWSTGLHFSGLKNKMSYFQIPFPNHPVFNGIKQEDIYLPNKGKNARGYYQSYVQPFTKGMLAVGKNWMNPSMGMTLVEHKLGKGLFLVNTIEAVSQYQNDPVIQRYLKNLLSYVLSDAWQGDSVCEAPKDKYAIKPPKRGNCFQVDLAPYANRGLRDDKADDKIGGWDDTGPKDMRHFPTGMRKFAGIQFMITQPEKNDGKSVIVLGNERQRSYFPREVKGIDVRMRRAKRLFFLVSAAWCDSNGAGEEIGSLTVNYKGGNTLSPCAIIPLSIGRNINEWTNSNPALSEAVTAWSKKHPLTGDNCSVFVFEWINPEPQGIIQTIDFSSNGKSVPILLGISGEKP